MHLWAGPSLDRDGSFARPRGWAAEGNNLSRSQSPGERPHFRNCRPTLKVRHRTLDIEVELFDIEVELFDIEVEPGQPCYIFCSFLQYLGILAPQVAVFPPNSAPGNKLRFLVEKFLVSPCFGFVQLKSFQQLSNHWGVFLYVSPRRGLCR